MVTFQTTSENREEVLLLSSSNLNELQVQSSNDGGVVISPHDEKNRFYMLMIYRFL